MFDGMTACLNKGIWALHLAVVADRKRGLSRAQVPAPLGLCLRPSSVVLQTEGSEKHFESDSKDPHSGSSLMGSGSNSPILNQVNTVGVIGGVSALSTVSFLEKLVRWGTRDGAESPPFVVCSDPELSREMALLRKKSSIPYARLRRTYIQSDHAYIVENLRRKRMHLEQTGARCIVMPCHVCYAWFEEVSEGCSVPFLHIGQSVAEALKQAKLKPVETGSSIKIGIIAPDPVLARNSYQEKLQNQGFEVVLPDEATLEHTVIPAMDALNRNDIEGARNLVRIALQVLLVHAVNTIILSSDELRGLLLPDDPLLKKCTDPIESLARSTIQWAHSQNP